jgi:hypothetical protein
MRFNLVDQAKEAFPVHRLCSVLGIVPLAFLYRPTFCLSSKVVPPAVAGQDSIP